MSKDGSDRRAALQAKLALKKATRKSEAEEANEKVGTLCDVEALKLIRATVKNYASKPDQCSVADAETLKILYSKFVILITKPSHILTVADVNTISACISCNWSSQATTSATMDYLLEYRDVNSNQEFVQSKTSVLLRIAELINLKAPFQIELECIYRLVHNGYIDVAVIEWGKTRKQHSTEFISNHDIENTALDIIFTYAVSSYNLTRVMECVSKFSMHVQDRLIVEFANSQQIITATPFAFVAKSQTISLKEKQAFFKYFKEQGMKLEISARGYDQENQITPLMLVCSAGSIEGVKLLLAEGIDINEVTMMNRGGVNLYRTPFVFAVLTLDFDFLKFMLDSGAEPFKAADLTSIACGISSGMRFFNVNELREKIPDEEQKTSYLIAVMEFIESYYVAKLLESLAPHIEDDGSDRDDHVEDTASKPKEDIDTALDEYLAVKQRLAQAPENSAVKHVHEFEAMLLNYVRTQDEALLLEVHKMLEEHPELYFDSVISVLDESCVKDVGDTASEILQTKPELLHKFFIHKKQELAKLQDKQVTTHAAELSDVWEVGATGFKNKVYVKFSPHLRKELDACPNKDFVGALGNAISSCQFIKKNAASSGIKMYGGIAKFKVKGYDLSVSSKIKIVDKYGNVIIIFDELQNHAEVERSLPYVPMRTTDCDDIFTYLDDIEVAGHSFDIDVM